MNHHDCKTSQCMGLMATSKQRKNTAKNSNPVDKPEAPSLAFQRSPHTTLFQSYTLKKSGGRLLPGFLVSLL